MITSLYRACPLACARLEAWLEAEREQLPLWLPVGLVGGIGAWFGLPGPAAWIGFLLVSAAVAVQGLGFGRSGRAGRAIALFALAAGIGCGLVWAKAIWSGGERLPRAEVVSFSARIERVEPLPARGATRLLLRPLAADGLPLRVRVTVREEDAPGGVMPGAEVTLRARLVPPPAAAVPGAYDYSAVAWFRASAPRGARWIRCGCCAPRRPAGRGSGWRTHGSRSPGTSWPNCRAGEVASRRR